jgi:putative ABC transport system substrate-binding protein
MDRRTFVRGTVVWLPAIAITRRASVAHAQAAGPPVVGFLRSTPAASFAHLLTAFRDGLAENGYVEGRNVVVEQRWADNRYDRLPALAGELVRRRVSVIVANSLSAEAAKAAIASSGTSIPLVFVSGDDPVRSGLIADLRRPAGNITGITFFGGAQLGAKRLELLRELVPKATVIGVLLDPNYPPSLTQLPLLEAAAQSLGRGLSIERAAVENEFEPAVARIVKAGAGALLVSGSPFYTSRRRTLVGLAARHALPAIYDVREFVTEGGLMSYSASLTAAYREAGVYAGRILKGAKPSELPIVQPTTFDLAINLKTARSLGLEVPASIQLLANEVVQ